MSKYEKGNIVKGIVSGIESYGAFITLDEYYTGLIHISEISHTYIKKITDYLNVGEIIYVQILEVDKKTSHLKLSIKNIQYKLNCNKKQKKIIETNSGFKTLAYKLPRWISKSIEISKKEEKKLN